MDIMDAALSNSGPAGTFTEASFVNSQLWGREQEIAEMMQEQSAGSVDDVIELWNTLPERNEKVVPECWRECDLGAGIDWKALCVSRRKSESDAGLLLSRPDVEWELDVKEVGERRGEIILGRGRADVDVEVKAMPSRRKRVYSFITSWLTSF